MILVNIIEMEKLILVFMKTILKDGLNWKTNKYSDVCQFQMDYSPDMRLWERRLLYCVPVSNFSHFLNALNASRF